MKTISILTLFLFLTTSCSRLSVYSPPISSHTVASTTKSHTPSSSVFSNQAEVENVFPETKKDRAGIIAVSILGGVLAVAGIVVPIILLK